MKKISRGAVRVIFAPLKERHASDRSKGLEILGVSKVPGRTIQLDPRVPFTDTIIHELLHVRYPGWTEKEVVAETGKLVNTMTWKDKAQLLRDVCGSAHLEGEQP